VASCGSQQEADAAQAVVIGGQNDDDEELVLERVVGAGLTAQLYL
jgi:hypothetical protein